MKKSPPQPRSRKTPTGGRMMARRILQISLAVKGMVIVCFVNPQEARRSGCVKVVGKVGWFECV
jgi:hypothetical protein